MSDIQIKSTGNIRVKLHPVGAGSITSDLRDGVDLDAYPKFDGAVMALESLILTLALAKVDVGSHVFGSAVQQTIDGITMVLLDAEALRQMGAPTPITENVSELPAQSGVSNKPATLEVDDIKSHIFERINNRQQDRPFTRDRLEDGNWKFVHNLDAKTAVDQQMKRLRAIELERNALRTEVEELKKRIQLSFEQRETEFREMGSTLNAAVQFANKVERGDVRFAKSCDEQLTAISQMALGKRLADAVARVLSERDEARGLLSAMLKERDELRKTVERLRGEYPTCAHCRGEIGVVLTTLTDQAAIKEDLEAAYKRRDTVEPRLQAEIDQLKEDKAMIDWLEKRVTASPTGVSFDWCRYVEDEQVLEHGFRFMCKHFLGGRKPSLRQAIKSAMIDPTLLAQQPAGHDADESPAIPDADLEAFNASHEWMSKEVPEGVRLYCERLRHELTEATVTLKEERARYEDVVKCLDVEREKGAKLTGSMQRLTGSMQRLWERLPDDADSTQEAQFDGLNEAHQLLSELKKKQTECGAVQEDLGIACSPSSVPRLVCEFIEASSLVPEGWKTWFWGCISENAPFTWGDLNRALVTASDFLGHCDTRLLDASNDHGVPQEDIDNFLCVLNKLGETYVDLEN